MNRFATNFKEEISDINHRYLINAAAAARQDRAMASITFGIPAPVLETIEQWSPAQLEKFANSGICFFRCELTMQSLRDLTAANDSLRRTVATFGHLNLPDAGKFKKSAADGVS